MMLELQETTLFYRTQNYCQLKSRATEATDPLSLLHTCKHTHTHA